MTLPTINQIESAAPHVYAVLPPTPEYRSLRANMP
jgi:hypothetical protein